MNDIVKIVQAHVDSDILLKGVTKTIKDDKIRNRWIFEYVIRYFRSKFVRKFKSRIWI